MLKKTIFFISALQLVSMLAPDSITDINHDHISQNNDLAIKHTLEQKELRQKQETELNRLYKKHAQEKNDIITKSNASFGTINEKQAQQLQIDLRTFHDKADQEEQDLQAKHEQQNTALKNKQQKDLRQNKNLLHKLSNLFSKSEEEMTPTYPLTPKTKSWTDSFNDLLGKGHKDTALKIIAENKESFAQNPKLLEETFKNLTDNERQEILNAWLKSWQEEYRNKHDSITLQKFYKNLDELKKNLQNLLPDNKRVRIQENINGWLYDVSISYLQKTYKKSPDSLSIDIVSTLPDLSKSKQQKTNLFEKQTDAISKAISDVQNQKNLKAYSESTINYAQQELQKFAQDKTTLNTTLSEYNNTDRQTILNNWIDSWSTSFDYGNTLLEKKTFSKNMTSSSIELSQKAKEKTAIEFMTGVEELMNNVNDMLPKNQELILVDKRGKNVNTKDLFHILDVKKHIGYEGYQDSVQLLNKIDITALFNPQNYNFKIVTES